MELGSRTRLTERGGASNEVAVSLLEITQRLGSKPDFTEASVSEVGFFDGFDRQLFDNFI
ncbi:hypothetical protein H4S14_003926 [Agrobacterium vitis]|nr:hypothetical protein [Agrobacterium vitis]